MEEQGALGDTCECKSEILKMKCEEDEDEFRSCCDVEDEPRECENCRKEDLICFNNECSVPMYFKGVSVSGPSDSYNSRASGIGVIIENSHGESPIRIQKRLDFYADRSVVECLALLDGLSLAIQNDIKTISAFTDSEDLCNQIIHKDSSDNPLLSALRQRIQERVSNLDSFVLKHVSAVELQNALQLAQVAIGIVSFQADEDESKGNCSICHKEKLSSMVLQLKCSHKFCSHCIKIHAEEKLKSSETPIKCPELRCNYRISADECRSFLPFTTYESLERVLTEANALNSAKIYCPYPDCLAFIDLTECSSTCSSYQSHGDSCAECRVCQRFICVDCGVPWHCSMTCEEYQNLPEDERDSYYSEDSLTTYHRRQQFEQWTWDSFVSLPAMMRDAYSDQERSQLALIQKFLARGFDLSDNDHHYPDHHIHQQSPPHDSYDDAMKDLHQLPWLERFVSVISDNYYEDNYIQ